MAGLGASVAAPAVWEILKASGIGPARQSGPELVAVPAVPGRGDPGMGFFTAGLPDSTQAYVLAVTGHATRRIRILGVTLHPTGQWTAQQARNLLMDLGEQAEQVKFMIRDPGSDFTAAFSAVLADASIRTAGCTVRTPRITRSPNAGPADAAASSWTPPSSGTRPTCIRCCASTRPTTTSTGRTDPCMAPRRSSRHPSLPIPATTASENALAPVA
jgi:hypothetical protein